MLIKSDFADNFQKRGVTWGTLGRDTNHLAALVTSDTAYEPQDFTGQWELVLDDLRPFPISSPRQTFLRRYWNPWLAGVFEWLCSPTNGWPYLLSSWALLTCNTRIPGSVHGSIQSCKAGRKVYLKLCNCIMHPTVLPSIKHLEQWCSNFSPTCTFSCNPDLSVVAQGYFLLFESGSRSQGSRYFYAPLWVVHHKLLALYVPCCMHLTTLARYRDLSHITTLQHAPCLILHCNFQGVQARFGLETTKQEAMFRKPTSNHLKALITWKEK